MESVNLEECEQFAVELAKKAGKMITDTRGSVTSIESKASFADLVTETDKNVETLIFNSLRDKYPAHKFIGEEGVGIKEADGGKAPLTDDPTWIVDPVDGTMNFVHTLPYVAVCIGMAINKQPVLGVVFCPALNQLFTARKGNGAFCNGTKLRVRQATALRDSLVCTEIGSDRSTERAEAVFKNMRSVGWQCHGLRSLGSAALDICSVAQGHMNAFWEFGLHCWDTCAASVVAMEAGAHVCDTTGGPLDLMNRRIIVASSESVAQELAKALVVQMDLPRD